MLLEKVLETGNLANALARVVRNGGAAGIDGMGVEQLQAHYDANWPKLRDQILEGNSDIMGVILESYLLGGRQSLGDDPSSLAPGVSVTDPCLDWNATEEIVLWAYETLESQSTKALEQSLCPC